MTAEEMTPLAMSTIRRLSIDAVEQAKSGHPGRLVALAPLIYTIWNRVMRSDPEDPIWPYRDRFVLSNDHASMPPWSRLHLPRTKAGERQLRKTRPGVGLSRRYSAFSPAACRGGAGIDLRMGAIRREGGLRYRNENVWRIGTTQRTPGKVRLRA